MVANRSHRLFLRAAFIIRPSPKRDNWPICLPGSNTWKIAVFPIEQTAPKNYTPPEFWSDPSLSAGIGVPLFAGKHMSKNFLTQCWFRLTEILTSHQLPRSRGRRSLVRLEPLEVRTLLAGDPFGLEFAASSNNSPVVAPVQFLIGENSVNRAFIGHVVATEVDPGQTTTFSIVAGNTNNAFAIHATTGVLSVKNSAALDFEKQSRFDLTVRVDDNGVPSQFGTATVTVFLQDTNDAPVVPNTGFLIGENSVHNAFIGTVASSDQDPGQSRTYSIVAGNDDDAFALHPTTGVLTVNNSAALDYKTRTHINLTVRVADNGNPARAGYGIATVFLRDENDAPVVTPAQFLIGEDSVNNAFIGVVPARDEDAAQPAPLGVLYLAQQTSSLALSGALLPTGDLGDRGTVLTSEVLRDNRNSLAPISTTTLLTDVRNSSSTAALFMAGQTVEYTPKKGRRTIDAVPFPVTATTTVQDFLTYVTDSLAIQTQADDPTIPNDSGTGGSPGATLKPNGTIQIVGNGGRLNEIDTTVGDITTGSASVSIQFTKSQAAVGEGTGTDFVLFDSLGRPINARLITNLESRTAGLPTFRWFIESVEDAGTDVAIATGTFDFNSLGEVARGGQATISLDRSNTGAMSPMRMTIDFSQISGISTESAGSRLNLTALDGSQPGTWSDPVDQNTTGQTLTYSIVAGNTDDAFAINPSTGVLTVNNAAALDYESRQRFDLIIRVADNGNPAQAGFGTVTVFLRDVVGARPGVPTVNKTSTVNSLTRLLKKVA